MKISIENNIGNSSFSEMKNISISDKYSVSILKNCDKKVYFIHNILDN
jgi:hypothetical protein